MRSASVEGAITAFRDSRIEAVGVGRTPVSLEGGHRVVLHLIPFQSFSTRVRYDMSTLEVAQQQLWPMGEMGHSNRITLDGVLTHTRTAASTSLSYALLFRTGVIEAVDASVLYDEGGILVLPGVEAERRLLKATGRYLNVLRDMEVELPVYCFVTLVGVGGATMDAGNRFGLRTEPLAEPVIELPESVLSDYTDGPAKLLRTPIDAMWNAFGYRESPNFDEKGGWNPR